MKIKSFFICILMMIFIMGNLVLRPKAVVAEDKVRWRMATCWSPNILLIEGDKHFIELVKELSKGDINIKLFPDGALVSCSELFDAVSDNTVQAGGNWPPYWAGKNSAFDLLGSWPMGLTNIDYQIWYYQGGGRELYQELYGKYNQIFFPLMFAAPESGIRGNKPISKIEDFKGLKLRVPGRMQGEILSKLGASQVNISGGELYQALEKGVIDGGEFSSPGVDWGMGFQEVTKFWCAPGWHQPTAVNGVSINKDAWQKLSPHQKKIIETAADATVPWMHCYLEKISVEGTQKFIDAGIDPIRLNDNDLDKILQYSLEIMLKYSKENPMYAKIAYSQLKFWKDSSTWRHLASPFSYGRVVKLPDLEPYKVLAERKANP